MAKVRSCEDIVKEFNATVTALITRAEKKTRDRSELANLDRVKKRLQLLRSTMGSDAPLISATGFFIEYSEKILEPDSEIRDRFFIDMDIRAKYTAGMRHVDKEDEFIFTLADVIKNRYKAQTLREEKELIYHDFKTLMECCIEHRLNYVLD